MSIQISDSRDQALMFRPSWGPGMALLWVVLIGLSLLPVAALLAISGWNFSLLPDGHANVVRIEEIADPIAIALCLLVASRLRYNPIDVLALRFPTNAVRVLKIAGFILLLTTIASIVAVGLYDGDDPSQQANAATLGQNDLMEGFISAALLAPIKEEMLFRGILLLSFFNTRLWFWSGAVLSSALFAFVHNPTSINLLLHAPYFLLGLGFAAALRYTGSLWVPIGLHALKNSIAVLIVSFG
jgi:membrane protease YdiL (CAAX protease family)